MKKVRFENELARQLYMEVSALADVGRIKREYISQEYIWKIWLKVYRSNFGSTRHSYLPGELSEKKEEDGGEN